MQKSSETTIQYTQKVLNEKLCYQKQEMLLGAHMRQIT